MPTLISFEQAVTVSICLAVTTALVVLLRRRRDLSAWRREAWLSRYNPFLGALLFAMTHPSTVNDSLASSSGALHGAVMCLHLLSWMATLAAAIACVKLSQSGPEPPQPRPG